MAEVNARRYGYPVDEIRKNIETVNQQGKNIGLDMHYDRSRYTNTFDAHRLTKLAESKGNPRLTDAIQERLFTAYFTESAELADHPGSPVCLIQDCFDGSILKNRLCAPGPLQLLLDILTTFCF